MNFLDASAVLLTFAAIFAYINFRFIKLPNTIGIMLIGLFFSTILIALGDYIPAVSRAADHFVEGIDFDKTLMQGLLSYLLFAGALHVNLSDLKDQKRLVATLATLGVIISTVLTGTLFFFLFPLLGFKIPFIWCLVLGAIISPTDPVAVLGILKKAKVPKSLETKITGESLFNDGVGVVVYLALLGIAMSNLNDTAASHETTPVAAIHDNVHSDHNTSSSDETNLAVNPSPDHTTEEEHNEHGESHAHEAQGFLGITKLFVVEVAGGILWGALLGAVGYYLLRSIDNYQVEVLITLALVTGGYRAASAMHISGPLAMVVTGLMIGNHARKLAMSEVTRSHVDKFWELIDEILNAVLFLLIGLELFVLDLSWPAMLAGVLAIVLGLGSRFLAVSLPVHVLKNHQEFSPGVIRILTWGGIRGGISVALALGIPEAFEHRNTFLVITYVVVIFSIAVQGLTLGKVVARYLKKESASASDAPLT